MQARYLMAMMTVITRHLEEATNGITEDAEWWSKNAPTGCVSPLGTLAAAAAAKEAYFAMEAKGFFRGVTLPFIIATFRELAYLALFVTFLCILPIAVPFIFNLRGESLGWGWAVTNGIVCGIAANLTMKEYKRLL